jgi:tRNA(Ile)-lysidine synthase
VKTRDGSFSIGQLQERLAPLSFASRIWVGFSGGADSTALLVALKELESELPAEFAAVHFNHGLQASADEWQSHCELFCSERNIPIAIHRLELHLKEGKSAEEQARNVRYRKIENFLEERQVYLTAHHADDNAETLFLNLMRGSGLDGLAGVPPLRSLGRGWVARPLLDFRRRSLEVFLLSRNISWLQDPSNLDTSFDRNFLRNIVFPALEKRWPGLAGNLNQTSRNARDSANVLAQLLTHPLANPVMDEYTLSVDVLLGLNDEVQTAVLRHWIREKGAPIPPRRRLQQFLDQLRNCTTGANRAELRWAGQLMKRHQGVVWWHRLPSPALKAPLPWAHGDKLDLEPEFGSIKLPGSHGTIPPGWEVGPLRPGARMQLHASGPRRKLIDLLREWGIPPWLRYAVPVLYWDGAAVALGDSVLEPRLSNWLSEQDASILWHPAHPILRKLKSVCTQPSERNNMQHE